MRNPDHAPFYFSVKNRRIASDADDPTASEVREAGTPTGETGRETEEADDAAHHSQAAVTRRAIPASDWKPNFRRRNK